MPSLLAVDLGLRTGMALFGADGKLRWVRSQNLGTRGRLRRAVGPLLREIDDLAVVVLEGGGDLAEIWRQEAARAGVKTHVIDAQRWREDLLHPRERRSGDLAKSNADRLARSVIAWSGLRNLTSLRHDAAEAVLVGLWGVRAVGWIDSWPPELRR